MYSSVYQYTVTSWLGVISEAGCGQNLKTLSFGEYSLIIIIYRSDVQSYKGNHL